MEIILASGWVIKTPTLRSKHWIKLILDEDNDNGIVLSDTNSNDSDLKEDDTNNKIESFGLPTFVIIEPLQNGAAMFLLVQLMFWYIPKY